MGRAHGFAERAHRQPDGSGVPGEGAHPGGSLAIGPHAPNAFDPQPPTLF